MSDIKGVDLLGVPSLLVLVEKVDGELGFSASHGCRCGGNGEGGGGTVSMSKNNYIVPCQPRSLAL